MKDLRYTSSTSTRETLDESAIILVATLTCTPLHQLSIESRMVQCTLELAFLLTKPHHSFYWRHFQKYQVSCQECHIFSFRICIALLSTESCLQSLRNCGNFPNVICINSGLVNYHLNYIKATRYTRQTTYRIHDNLILLLLWNE